jgi:hypothetical protein
MRNYRQGNGSQITATHLLQVVTQDMQVSDLPTTEMVPVAQPPMPACRYDVLDGDKEGAAVVYARVGQAVYHKWTCDYPISGG